MMSRVSLIVGLTSLMTVIALTIYIFYKQPRVVYVDSVKLINGYQGMIDAKKLYQSKALSWRANIDTLAKEVQREISRYDQGSGSWTARERELSRTLVQTKQKQLADYQRAVNEMAGQEDAASTGKVVGEINAYIRKHSEAHGYTLVLAATDYGNVAYAAEYLDITDAVLAGLNAGYGKGSTPVQH